MSIGGVNNIKGEPLRRASKGELDEVEGGGGGGTEYHGIAPIVVSGDAISIQMDGAPVSGSGNAVASGGVKEAVDGKVDKVSDSLQTIDSLISLTKNGKQYIRTWGGTTPTMELGSSDVPVGVPDTTVGQRGAAAANLNRLMDEIAAIPKDDFPTSGSENLVKSGGVYYACNNLQQGITQNTNAIVSLQTTKQDNITVSWPLSKSGSGVSLPMDATPTQGSGIPVTSDGIKAQFDNVAQDLTTLGNAINTVSTNLSNAVARFGGLQILGYWSGYVSVNGVTKFMGNLTVQSYGSTNPGLYLISGFNKDYRYRMWSFQIYHGQMALAKPQNTTSATQCQFTINSPDGSALSDEMRVDIILYGTA